MAYERAEILAGAAVLAVAMGFAAYAVQGSGMVGAPASYPLTASFRSVNGWTDTRALLDCVGQEGVGAERFRTVLRAVKAWAKARGVYSHALGYLGGLSWAVMVAWAYTRAPREVSRSDCGRATRPAGRRAP